MAGLCGSFGPEALDVSPISSVLSLGGEHETYHANGGLEVRTVTHDAVPQPARTDDGVSIWAWGNVYSHESDGGEYVPRAASHPGLTPPEYCAALFEEYGLSFVERLNSEFALVVHDERAGTVHLVTDRLGSRPLYLYETAGARTFSTSLQALASHPAVECEFDERDLATYFARKHVPGRRTPLRGITRLSPATVHSYDSTGGEEPETRRFWKPQYDPVDEPKSHFVSELAGRVSEALDERLAAEDDVGILLSGGDDSRLLVGLNDRPIRCYHMNDWKNEEFEIASRVAALSGNEFTFLRRDEDYHRRVLEGNAPRHDFVSEFHQAHAGGFRETLARENDVLLSGMYGDTFFKGHFLPKKRLESPLGRLELPLLADIDTLSDYIETLSLQDISFLNTAATAADAVRDQVTVTTDGIEYGGVAYDDLRALVFTDDYYPLTNQPDYLFHSNLMHIAPTHTPFIDNRVIDLHLSVPLRHQVRGQLIKEVVSATQPRLAALKHPETGIALDRGYAVQFLGKNFNSLVGRGQQGHYERPYYTDSAWSDGEELIRHTDLVGEKLREHRGRLTGVDLFDRERAVELYRRHMAGENYRPELYRLLSVLEMPATARVADRMRVADGG